MDFNRFNITIAILNEKGNLEYTSINSDTSDLFPLRWRTERASTDIVFIYKDLMFENEILKRIDQYHYFSEPMLIKVNKESEIFEFFNIYSPFFIPAILKLFKGDKKNQIYYEDFLKYSRDLCLIILRQFKDSFKKREISYKKGYKDLHTLSSAFNLLKLLTEDDIGKVLIQSCLTQERYLDIKENIVILNDISKNKNLDIAPLAEKALNELKDFMRLLKKNFTAEVKNFNPFE